MAHFEWLLALILWIIVLLNCTFAQEDELDALRKNIPGEPGKDYPTFSTNILCKINPRNPGCGGGGGVGKKGQNGGNGGARQNGGNKGGQKRSQNEGGRKMAQNGGNAQGGDELDALRKNIPGEPGKDYPIFSFSTICKINPAQCGGAAGGGR